MRDATIKEQESIASHIESASSKTGFNFFDKLTLVKKIENLINEIDQDMQDDLYLISVDMSDGRAYAYLRDIKWKLENILSSE